MLIGKVGNISTVLGMFDSHSTDISVTVQIQKCVLILISSLCDVRGFKFNIQRICFLEIFDFHSE